MQKRRICRENCNYALDERFHGRVCPRRKPAKSCHPVEFLYSYNNPDTIVSVAPVAISQSQAVLLYTSLCDPRLSRFPEAATAIMCFSNKCVIYIVFFLLKSVHTSV